MDKYEIYNYRFLFTTSQYVLDNLGHWISMKYNLKWSKIRSLLRERERERERENRSLLLLLFLFFKNQRLGAKSIKFHVIVLYAE